MSDDSQQSVPLPNLPLTLVQSRTRDLQYLAIFCGLLLLEVKLLTLLVSGQVTVTGGMALAQMALALATLWCAYKGFYTLFSPDVLTLSEGGVSLKTRGRLRHWTWDQLGKVDVMISNLTTNLALRVKNETNIIGYMPVALGYNWILPDGIPHNSALARFIDTMRERYSPSQT